MVVRYLWKEDYMDMLDEMILKRIFRVQRVNNEPHTSNHHKTGKKNNYIKHILGSYFIKLFSYTFSKLNNGKIIGLGAYNGNGAT